MSALWLALPRHYGAQEAMMMLGTEMEPAVVVSCRQMYVLYIIVAMTTT